jgi:hypothetical protein
MKNTVVSDLAVACIYAEDHTFVKPIREFLEASGTRICVNTKNDIQPTYQVISGNYHFVKSITSKLNFLDTSTLILVTGNQCEEVENILLKKWKCVYLNSDCLPATKVQKIFQFWFTSNKRVLDLREERVINSKINESIINPQITKISPDHDDHTNRLPRLDNRQTSISVDNREEVDRQRINQTIKDVYETKEIIKSKPIKSKYIFKFYSFIIFGFSIIFVINFLYLTSLGVSGLSLLRASEQLDKGQIKNALTYIYISNYCNRQADIILSLLKLPLKPFGQISFIRHQEQLISFVSDIADVTGEGAKLTNESKSLSATILSEFYGAKNETTSIPKTLEVFKTELPTIHNKIGLSTAELSMLIRNRVFPFNLKFIAKRGNRLISKLDQLRNEITYLEKILHVYESIAGFKERKTYLILFQNSMELRPTGGFIGSFAETTFIDGRIESLKVQDVYTVDGQLKGHVDPPIPIREILNNEHWYLRDSNWDPNFSKSGKIASWFYEKETGKTVDGVIAISTPFLIDVLKATGPIDLVDYKDRISADNFFGKSLYYVQNNFFPGSTQKQDFLGTLVKEILRTASQNKNISSVKLMQALHNAMDGGEIMFYFNNPKVQQIVTQYEWDGDNSPNNICSRTELAYQCYPDYLRIVEANLSVSKVNYFIKRSYTISSVIGDDGKIDESVSIKFTNSANGKEPGQASNYRNYMRIYVPSDSIVSGVSIDGTFVSFRLPKTEGKGVFPYAEFVQDETNPDVQSIGVAFDVPAQKEKLVVVSYVRTKNIDPGNSSIFYRMGIIKQPGVRDTQVESSLKFPSTWIATPQSETNMELFLANSTQLEYNTILNQNIYSTVLFQKKE